MRYIFGPVYSRRFGISLGIDLSPDKKRCNFDCLYCELDRAKPVDRYDNPPESEEIVREVKEFLERNEYPDVITVTANGEPTLYPYLDKLIDQLKEIKGKSKLLILSNGSTIYNPSIRRSLSKLDIVKLSLDAADEKIFRKVDRGLKNIKVSQIIEGMKAFRKEFSGELIIEILVVKYVNDSVENIKKIVQALKEIKPDRVDLGTVDRPPAYRVFPVSNERLHQLAGYLKDFNVNVVERKYDKSYQFDLSKEDIINTISKRPLTEEDIQNTFSLESKKILEKLLKENVVKKEEKDGMFFYMLNSKLLLH